MTIRAGDALTVNWVVPERVDLVNGGGGGIRQVHLLRRVASRHRVRLVALGPTLDDEVARRLEDAMLVGEEDAFAPPRKASQLAALSGRTIPEVESARPFEKAVPSEWLVDDDSATVLTHLSMQSLPTAGQRITHFHHLTSTQLRDEVRLSGRVHRRRAIYARTARRLERRAIERADLTVVVSEQDRQALSAGTRKLEVVPNGVATAGLAALAEPTGSTVLLPGSLDYGPNVDGAVFFVREVWPSVLASVPDAELVIAGRRPAPEVAELGRTEGVRIRPDVPDMNAEFAAARVVVVPLRYGSGTRLKVLEALAAGRSVVGTPVGLAGLGLQHGVHARFGDTPQELAHLTVEALRSDDRGIHGAGKALVRDDHEWDRIGDQMAELISLSSLRHGQQRRE